MKKHLAHSQAELSLSRMCPVWGSNHNQTQQSDDQMVKCGNETSALLTTPPQGPSLYIFTFELNIQKMKLFCLELKTSARHTKCVKYSVFRTMLVRLWF